MMLIATIIKIISLVAMMGVTTEYSKFLMRDKSFDNHSQEYKERKKELIDSLLNNWKENMLKQDSTEWLR